MKKILLIIFVFTSIITSANSLDIYLSPKGKDTNNGSVNAPVRTIKAARLLIQKMTATNTYDEINVLLKSGDYKVTEENLFDSNLFNGQDVKLNIKSIGKRKAIISGGKRIPTRLFGKVRKSQYKKLHKKATGKVYVADLKNTPYENAFNLLDTEKSDYTGGAELPKKTSNFSILTWNAYSLRIAQWPNRGYHHIENVSDAGPTTRWLKPNEFPAPYTLENPTGAKFTTVEKADWKKWDAEFKKNGQVVAQGYFHNDWYYQNEQIGDLNNGEIKLLHHTRYGVIDRQKLLPRRVRIVNLLCELDQPGEWHYDSNTKKLYIWPIARLKSSVNISVAGGDKMFVFDNLNNITIENIAFRNGGKLGVEIIKGNNNKIANCEFKNFVGKGVQISESKNTGIIACEFSELLSAASISGGDRKTLEHSNNYFTNNEVHHCRLRGYGVLGIHGVGIHCNNNLFHTMNGALSFSGNDNIIEHNEFYNMGWEMGDWNAAYIGADWASFGNKFQYNFIHHLMETPGAYPVEGVRNDDLGMGVEFKGNIFYKSGRGSIAFSGAGNNNVNNIALETSTVWQAFFVSNDIEKVRKNWEKKREYDDGILRRGDKDDNLWRAEQNYGKMGWLFEPYRSKYPTLKKIMNDGNAFAPTFGVIANNYVQNPGKNKGFYMHGCSVKDLPATTTWEFPEPITMDAFVDPSVLNFKMKDSFVPQDGFEKIEFEKIGLVVDEYRKTIQNKDEYRKAIKNRYNNIKSAGGRYDIKTAYKRFPIPVYLK